MDENGSGSSAKVPFDPVLYRLTGNGMAILLDIQPGDEVIMPSYIPSVLPPPTLLCAASGAKVVFVDIRPTPRNIDETKIEVAITDKTKADCTGVQAWPVKWTSSWRWRKI